MKNDVFKENLIFNSMSSTFHTICYHKQVINSRNKQHFKMTSWQGMPLVLSAS